MSAPGGRFPAAPSHLRQALGGSLPRSPVALEVLEAAGFKGRDALQALRTLAAYASGFILAETGGFFRDARTHPPPLDEEAISSEEFPRLVAIQEYLTGIDEDQQFELGLDVILDGLEAGL